MKTRRRRPEQLTFADRPRADDKVRQKPGPKPRARANVRHLSRPVLKRWNPIHVTLRAASGLTSFRTQVTFAALERAVRDTKRPDFRVVEYSVQHDHVHLLVEADDKGALARGMKAFSVRANRLFNAATGRGRGRVWGDRYHRRDLTSPREVRSALVYCLQNGRKHGVVRGHLTLDPCSSAAWFSGWSLPRTAPEARPPPAAPARTALLGTLWRRHGLIHPAEVPAPSRRERSRRSSHARAPAQA